MTLDFDGDPRFDEVIDRRGTHSSKWDTMERNYGVSPDGGLPMWVADMDFRPPACVQECLDALSRTGVYGYYGDDASYREAIIWWMQNRHGWQIAPEDILTSHGLVNGTALCVDTFTQPGDAVLLFTPIYHAFFRVLEALGREIVQCPMALDDAGYSMDLERAEAMLTGREKMLILCSPHNPGGRAWRPDELRAIAEFCAKHGMILVSDEIHHDLVMPGHTHTMTALAAPEHQDLLITMTAPTKTFNIAGAHTGNLIVRDKVLRGRLAHRIKGLGISPNMFGLHMTEAAYTPAGAEWVDGLCRYLDGNRKIFEGAIDAIPGLRAVPLEATYLAWVDFSGTGMDSAEVIRRIETDARIAASHGATFGEGGGSFMRFNLAMPRVQIEEAVSRLQEAFGDLQ